MRSAALDNDEIQERLRQELRTLRLLCLKLHWPAYTWSEE